MTDALHRIAAQLGGGPEDRCEFNHPRHDRIEVQVGLPGSAQQPMTVFNWFRYETTEPGFCEGRDEVSKGIQHARSWEAEASGVVSTLLARFGTSPGVVIDLGAHVGWYTKLARMWWRPTLAVDASDEHLEVLAENAPDAVRCRGWIGPDTPVISPEPNLVVALLKIDIEGMEAEALRVFEPLLPNTQAVLMEVTPTRDMEAVDMLDAHGFTRVTFADRPGAPGVAAFPDGQENYLFERLR